jgi:hypothetical protein
MLLRENPGLDVAHILDRRVAALTERLREEFREERQQLAHRDAFPADQESSEPRLKRNPSHDSEP